jgi:hypothetical protein
VVFDHIAKELGLFDISTTASGYVNTVEEWWNSQLAAHVEESVN